MTLDIFTLQVSAGAIILMASTLFLVQSWDRRGEVVDRLWMLALCGAIATAVITAAQELDSPTLWWLVGLGNGTTVLVPFALWNGARAGAGRPTRLWVSVMIACATVAAGLLEGPDGGHWAGAEAYLLGVSAGCLIAGLEIVRSPLRRYRSGVGLAVLLLATAAFFVVRLLAFVTVGPEDPTFVAVLGTTTATLWLAGMVNGAALFMVALRGDQGVADRPGALRYDPLTGARPPGAFATLARQALGIGAQRGVPMCLVRVRIDDAPAIRTAFGETRADAAYATCGDVLRAVAQPGTLVGLEEDHSGFQVVLEDVTAERARRWADELRRQLLDAPVEMPGVALRLVVSVGVAGTDQHGHDLDELRTSAQRALREATRAGGDQVRVAADAEAAVEQVQSVASR
ncbi:hypothetical protein GCM10023169_01340 [Georgenia halophila]|uniref:GGDEF domain-containing protein n=1 Tax=Georgenia halophila TaxID=620889 RepID=A0ABP8KSD4_9MICO